MQIKCKQEEVLFYSVYQGYIFSIEYCVFIFYFYRDKFGACVLKSLVYVCECVMFYYVIYLVNVLCTVYFSHVWTQWHIH